MMTDLVDYVLEIDKNNHQQTKVLINDINANLNLHYIICAHRSFRSAWTVYQLKAKKKVGYLLWWNFWAFNIRMKRSMQLPEALRQLELLSALDPQLMVEIEKQKKISNTLLYPPGSLKVSSEQLPIPDWALMYVPADSRESMATKIIKMPEYYQGLQRVFQLSKEKSLFNKQTALLAPGSQWGTKRWKESGYIEVGKALRKRGYEVVIIGTGEEKDICNRVATQIPLAHDLSGLLSVFELYQVMQKSQLLISNDNGAMHLASVAGLPTIAIFGPTVLEFGYRPWQDHVRVVEKDIECRPCSRHGPQICPLKTHECMKSISEFEVLDAVDALKKTTSRQAN